MNSRLMPGMAICFFFSFVAFGCTPSFVIPEFDPTQIPNPPSYLGESPFFKDAIKLQFYQNRAKVGMIWDSQNTIVVKKGSVIKIVDVNSACPLSELEG